ncbi:MAG: molybdate ABC transporter substrate-binding protein [Anaerolineales bacterium]|nr:molybdate ABC transporter substrate-binding protein [Anaerolineales bacterium]HRX01753.1 molybdate ABC transporter substrate-binding protein [Anaerolineae bacterium]
MMWTLKRGYLLVAILLLAGCSLPGLSANSDAKNNVTVFAAASLTDPFRDLALQFEADNPGVDVVFNFAGSQQLAQQLAQGAAVDLFASANEAQMRAVIDTGRVTEGKQRVFGGNKLVVVMPAENPAGLSTLQDLAKPDVKLVLAAKNVPVGDYSLAFLEKANSSPQFAVGYEEAVLSNVVSYEENVKAVLSKVVLGEADAGIVYSSDISPDVAGQVARISIPDSLNTLAAYPIAPVSDAPNLALAQKFLEFVLSPAGQAVLAGHGFIPVEEMD